MRDSKYIYLDQNKWIDLARSEHNRSGGEKFDQLYKFISDIRTVRQ